MKGQKEAVIEAVEACLPGFVKYADIALMMLTQDQLESIKVSIARDIEAGVIEYGKDHLNWAEVRPYARSMVMNHLKKAKELNGNVTYGSTVAQVASTKLSKSLSSIKMDILPNELAEFVKTLV